VCEYYEPQSRDFRVAGIAAAKRIADALAPPPPPLERRCVGCAKRLARLNAGSWCYACQRDGAAGAYSATVGAK
jgi:hypothetical protein